MLEASLRFFHLVALLIMATSSLILSLGLRPRLAADDISALRRVSVAFWVSVIPAAGPGLALWFWAGKPAAFYSGNPVFHAKIGLFVIYLLLATGPTWFLHRRATDAEGGLNVPRVLRWSMKLQLIVLLIMPALAYLMARGIGY